jgi:hypothetical protein
LNSLNLRARKFAMPFVGAGDMFGQYTLRMDLRCVNTTVNRGT